MITQNIKEKQQAFINFKNNQNDEQARRKFFSYIYHDTFDYIKETIPIEKIPNKDINLLKKIIYYRVVVLSNIFTGENYNSYCRYLNNKKCQIKIGVENYFEKNLKETYRFAQLSYKEYLKNPTLENKNKIISLIYERVMNDFKTGDYDIDDLDEATIWSIQNFFNGDREYKSTYSKYSQVVSKIEMTVAFYIKKLNKRKKINLVEFNEENLKHSIKKYNIDENLLKEDFSDALDLCTVNLTDRDVEILKDIYNFNGKDNNTYIKIAKKFDITRQRVAQIHQKALETIKTSSHFKRFEDIKNSIYDL